MLFLHLQLNKSQAAQKNKKKKEWTNCKMRKLYKQTLANIFGKFSNRIKFVASHTFQMKMFMSCWLFAKRNYKTACVQRKRAEEAACVFAEREKQNEHFCIDRMAVILIRTTKIVFHSIVYLGCTRNWRMYDAAAIAANTNNNSSSNKHRMEESVAKNNKMKIFKRIKQKL